jgi:hypothetical protein
MNNTEDMIVALQAVIHEARGVTAPYKAEKWDAIARQLLACAEYAKKTATLHARFRAQHGGK